MCFPIDGMPRAISFPADASRLEIDVVEHPPVFVGGLEAAVVVAGVVKSANRRAFLTARDRRGHKDVVVPDDRRAPANPGNRRLPRDVLGFTPGIWQGGVVGNLTRPGAAKLRPLIGRPLLRRQASRRRGRRRGKCVSR